MVEVGKFEELLAPFLVVATLASWLELSISVAEILSIRSLSAKLVRSSVYSPSMT
jgi:hypothetical protein